MQAIKAAAGLLLAIAGFAVLVLIALSALRGMNWLAIHVYPWVLKVAGVVLIADILLLPLAALRPVRPFAAAGFMLSGWVYGIANWTLGFLVAYHFWGAVGVWIGIFAFGFGVIPVGMLAALFHGAWGVLGNLVIGIVIWIAAIAIASFLEIHSRPKDAFVSA